jgi:phosphoglycerate dehydrogenase-like enzyme
MSARPIVVLTEDLDAECARWLSERAELVRCPMDDAAGLARELGKAEGLIVRTYTRVNGALLDRAARLKVVGRAGVGLDNIDVAECRRRGVAVVYTPDANSSAVAELVFAALFDVFRPRRYLERALGMGEWLGLRGELVAERQLDGLALGVWGMGRVGRRVARIGSALGMRVLYNDLVEVAPEHRHGATPVTVDRLCRESDVLSLHVDGRASNRGLLGAAALERVRPDVVIVNTSRGFVVDASALSAFLRAHGGATAILDVHDPEPIPADSPLLGLPNARLLPHLGAATRPAHRRMSWVVRDVWRVLNGERPEFPA